MTNEIVIITPEPSGAGGVGDYTQRLIEAWPGNTKPHVVVSKNISEQLPLRTGKIVVQYSAYGFDRVGYPRQLIRALIDWKNLTRGLLVVMFHEIWTFWPPLNKNAVVQFFHRRAIKRLIGCADAVFTTTPSQAAYLQKLCPGKSVRVLPVGSNIRRHEDVDLARRHGWAVLFGLGAGRVRALKQMRPSLSALAASGAITKIITVGIGDGSSAQEERDLLSEFQLREGFEQRGQQEEGEMSKLLLTAAYGISAQDELSLFKSGIFMAYAAHGLSVLNESADRAKSEPICLLVAPGELLRGVPETELKSRAERLRNWQGQTSSWPLISATFAEALRTDR